MVAKAQLSLPPNGDNQKTITRQYIGPVAYVEIVYNSPDVSGRDGNIWGNVVKYGMFNQNFGTSSPENPSPWRAGANENTTIEFSHDVLFQGKKVLAGKYSLHMIVKEKDPWTIILNTETRAWGSYFYRPEEDVLRVESSPGESPFTEYLTYDFITRRPNELTIAMRWDELMLPFTIEVPDNNEIILSTLESELKSFQTFQSRNWSLAATWASNNDYHEKALKWVNTSINDPSVGERNLKNINTKILVLLNMKEREKAIELALELINEPFVNAVEAHNVGGVFFNRGEKISASEIFKKNYKRFKGAWPTNFGMGRVYAIQGDFAKAIKFLERSKKNVPGKNPALIEYIDSKIRILENGEEFD